MAFRGAKRVITETELARGGASISSVAVDLATNIFGDLKGAKVALLGAGEMAQQAATYLRAEGAGEIAVVNRSVERGTALAQTVAGSYLPWDRLDTALIEADIVITSTGATEPIINKRMMKKVMRKRRGRTIFFVDIAVPRDIDPGVGVLEQVIVYDIDDLQRLVAQNMAQRGSQKDAALRVVEEEISAFLQWQRTRNIAPVMAGLQEFGKQVMHAELARMAPKLGELHPGQQKAVEALAHGIVKKMLHQPMTQLREAVAQGGESPAASSPDLAQALSVLFDLEGGVRSAPPGPLEGSELSGAGEDSSDAAASEKAKGQDD
jgi:glutamyl-tRNA reductase